MGVLPVEAGATGGGKVTQGHLLMMMKTFTTLLMSACIVAPAFAADMPLKAPPRTVPLASDWTGFYVFGFGGYSWGRISPDDISELTGDFDGTFHNPKLKGGVFGFGGGYNWQYGAWVSGVEVDYGFSNEKESQSLSQPILEEDCDGPCKVIGTSTTTLSSKIDALGSARLRAGYLFTPNVLAYGTAGLGWGRSQLTVGISDCFKGEPSCDVFSATAKVNHFGWVAGGGLEVRLFDHLRLRGEYLHFDFGSTSYAFAPTGTINAKARDDVARGALIWSF